jgi:hypothetical protein
MDIIEQEMLLENYDTLTYRIQRMIEIYGEFTANTILVEAYINAVHTVANNEYNKETK